MVRFAWILVLTLGLVACGDDDGVEVDAGGGSDAGGAVDAGAGDVRSRERCTIGGTPSALRSRSTTRRRAGVRRRAGTRRRAATRRGRGYLRSLRSVPSSKDDVRTAPVPPA